MSTYIKAGLWTKKKHGNNGELDLDLLIKNNASGSIATTLEGTIYSIDPSTNFGIAVPINSIILGLNAGSSSIDVNSSIILGDSAGIESSGAVNCNFIGARSGSFSFDSSFSNFFGENTGSNTINCNNSNFSGVQAGSYANNCNNSNFLGSSAGYEAINSYNSNFLGNGAGFGAIDSNNSNFFGGGAGASATTAFDCNFFGTNAGAQSTGNNVNAFGSDAAIGNTLSGQTIFSNGSLPSFINRAAAVAAISTATGGINENTYLYYNQTTFTIEAVRLED